MKIKRIVALALSVVLLCFTLVSCDEEIGSYLKNYDWEPEVIEDVYYDFYIIGGESDDIARSTVNDKLNQIFYDKFHTKIKIHYLDEAGYSEAIEAAVASSEAASTVPAGYKYGGKIVLINNVDMLDYLGDKLSVLDEYLQDTVYAKLNTQLPAALLAAAKLQDGTLAIPNNHKLGSFKYYVINRDIAENRLSFSAQTEIPEMTTEAAIAELVAEADKKGIVNSGDTQYFYEIDGDYALKAEIEKSGEWICNVASAPIVTVDMAYESAFGVVASPKITETVTVTKDDGTVVQEQRTVLDFAKRAMDLIYDINSDVTTRNVLQYGVENTNFTLDANKFVTPLESEGSKYNMNIEYTGDVMKAYYFGTTWTPALAETVKKQNASAVIPE